MTTHWNATLNDASPILPAHHRAARAPRHWNSTPAMPARHADLLLTMEANEVFLAYLEPTPDFSHCGINE